MMRHQEACHRSRPPLKKHYYRDAILRACVRNHLTVDEIFDRVREEFPSAGYSTIYRNVEELAETGELHKISGVGPKALFEKRIDGHNAHFIDRRTGAVYDLELPTELLKTALPSGFVPSAVDIRIYGDVPAHKG